MAEQLKFGDRLFLKGEKVLFDNGANDAIIESRNGTLVIKGNLTVEGTTTTVDTESTSISDPFILLNGDHTGPESEDVGIEINRGSEPNVKFGWDYTNDRWTTFGESLNVNQLSASGGVNADIVSDNGVVIIDTTGDGTVDLRGGNIDGSIIGANTPAAAYFTSISGDGTAITNVLTNYTTTDLSEGDNQYYTDEKVDDRLNAILDAAYGLTGSYDDPNGTYSISFDATNIGGGAELFDSSGTAAAKFRTLESGPNLDITVQQDGDTVVIDTAVKINNLQFNTFTGVGNTSLYTLPYTITQDWQILVYIDGVVQAPSVAYTMASGNTISLQTPLATNSVMNVIKMASNSTSVIIPDADTLNAQSGSYYLDYTNFTNTPTTVSSFTNDANYITSADIPTNYMVNDANNTVAGSISPSVDSAHDLGTATKQWNTIYGHAVEATYADLAERYAADAPYEPGTVLVFGGEAEITTTTKLADTAVVGIVSTDPALKMNSAAGNSETHPYIALKGRVPCKVIGEVNRGDLLVTSDKAGFAKKSLGVPMIGTVIGKAIGSNESGEGTVEVFVSMM